MLKGISLGMAVVINIIIICLWHLVSFILTTYIGQKHLNYRSFPFRFFKFEKYGKFYTENFDIDGWYTLIPVKINREGVTCKDIEEAEITDLKQYIIYTCRSELCCLLNCLYLVFSLIVNDPHIGFIVGVLVVFGNLPFIAVNRYYRSVIVKELSKKRKQREIIEYIEENNPDKYDLDSF